MKNFILLFALACTPACTTHPTDGKLSVVRAALSPPLQPFENSIQQALDYLKKEQPTLDLAKKTTAVSQKEALAIVFPELIRFSSLQDVVEVEANQWGYVKNGASASDFSTGEFQMRPSFVEALENYVDTVPELSNFRYILLKSQPELAVRGQRIQQMQQFQWQLAYAQVFWAAAKHRFRDKTFNSATDRVHFFATAYNYGFLRPVQEIERWQQRKAFPYGSKHTGEQAAYGDFATYFFNHHAHQF